MTTKIYVSVFRKKFNDKESVSLSEGDKMEIEAALEIVNVEPVWFIDRGDFFDGVTITN